MFLYLNIKNGSSKDEPKKLLDKYLLIMILIIAMLQLKALQHLVVLAEEALSKN